MKVHAKTSRSIVALAAAVAVLAAACSSAAPSAPAPITVVQGGSVQASPAVAQPSGWATAEAIRGQLSLYKSFDSSGPAAWDAAKHPTIFVSSMSEKPDVPEGVVSGAGIYVIDAYSKEVVASAVYDLGEEITSSPHTAGASPDGKWFYTMFADRVAATKETRNFIAIINAKTLKLDKVLQHPTQRLHHTGAFKDYAGNDRVIINLGFGATGGPHFLLDPKNDNKVVQAITFDNVRPMGHPYTIPSPDGKFLYITMGAPEIREADAYGASIAKWDIEKKTATVIHGVGNHPIGIAATADGKTVYANDGTNSLTFKIDTTTNKVVGKTSAGVVGPYGLALNWDQTELFTVGKGEGSHNRGGVLGLIDTKTFAQKRTPLLPEMPIILSGNQAQGGIVASVDHATLHPDPAVNELWVSNMAGNQMIVLDLATYKVKAYVRTPNGGNTHGGSFVKYTADFQGELLSDMFGPKGPMFEVMKAKAAAVK